MPDRCSVMVIIKCQVDVLLWSFPVPGSDGGSSGGGTNTGRGGSSGRMYMYQIGRIVLFIFLGLCIISKHVLVKAYFC